ncbi:uncharacterized protein V1516DRAFT_679200 [Lipomyces oligophaga]|uniref:uncharacterized protein n=1 Tax=Lipomyces oligophaga TaxID=45792 RepID=UPI0034CEBE44
MGNSSSSRTMLGPTPALPYLLPEGVIPKSLHGGHGSPDSNKKLQQLLRANEATYSVLYHERKFHNHIPHILGSAFFLGASSEQLVEIYEENSKRLEIWQEDSPAEVTGDDWRDFYGLREYQRGYRDYFTDEVVFASFDWKRVVFKYLLVDEAKLLKGLTADLAHPLIHLAYAFELGSAEVAIEALTLDVVCYPPKEDYEEEYMKIYVKLQNNPSIAALAEDPITILGQVRDNTELDNVSDTPFRDLKELILPFLIRLDLSNPNDTIYQISYATSLLVTATHNKGDYQVDFALVHTLTASHAVLILLPLLPMQYKISLLVNLWIFILRTYIQVGRPLINPNLIWEYGGVQHEQMTWDHIVDLALTGPMMFDPHYLKVIRALKALYENTPDDSVRELYLREAAMFATETKGYLKDFSGKGLNVRHNH